MKNQIRIREPRGPLPGEAVLTFSWANPRWKPIKDPTAKFVKRQEELDKDPAKFKSACQWNNL